MEEQRTLEKLGGHKYRLHQLWDGTPEMLDSLIKEGFTVSSANSDDYYRDFKEDDDNFNFGASVSECIQILFDNQYFYAAFFLELAMGNKDAGFGKQLVETCDSIDLLFPLIRFMRIDNFMYLMAKNYNKSLGEQAKEMFQKLDKAEFINWAKGVVEPRFSGSVTFDEIRPYLVFDENHFKGVNFLNVFYDSWLCVKENEEAFWNWMEVNEIRLKNPAEVFNDCILYPDDETTKLFAWCYWFGGDPCACHLFSMLNSPDVSIGVKSLLRDTLIDYGKGDVEFAKQLQPLYDEYRSINGGREINFVQQSFESEKFVFPEVDVKKHLAEDIVDDDQTSFIGKINNERNDPEKLAKVFRYLVENRYITPKELNTTIYRFTGKRKPQGDSLLNTVVWHGKINDALYICKEFYGGKYAQMLRFFDVDDDDDDKERVRKNYSSYADRPTKGLRVFFNENYLYVKKPE